MTSSLDIRAPGRDSDSLPAEQQRRGGWSGRAIVGLTVLALVACGIVVWGTPLLGLQTVDVVSADSQPVTKAVANDVRLAIAIPTGTPLARIDAGAVRERVLSVKSVSAASVARDWPHGLTVTVTERVAVASTQANGQWWLVDSTGLPFQQVGGKPGRLLPLELATPGVGDRPTMAAIAVVQSLSDDVRAHVVGVSAATAYDVRLQMTRGRTVIWGSDSDADAKNAVIPAMLQRPGKIFDVSDPTLVTVRDN